MVSNASDALEKIRFQTTAEAGEDEIPLQISVSSDKEAGTITITDTGIGMTRDELMKNIGTIAHSGTADLARMAQEGKESLDALIGRFGVGFYSVYMVADEVTVTTSTGDPEAKALSWTSDGKPDYKLQELNEDLPPGPRIAVKPKEDIH